MKKIAALIPLLFILACNSNKNGDDNPDLKDPATVQPPSENIPDSMTIKKDSVIVPDSTRHR